MALTLTTTRQRVNPSWAQRVGAGGVAFGLVVGFVLGWKAGRTGADGPQGEPGSPQEMVERATRQLVNEVVTEPAVGAFRVAFQVRQANVSGLTRGRLARDVNDVLFDLRKSGAEYETLRLVGHFGEPDDLGREIAQETVFDVTFTRASIDRTVFSNVERSDLSRIGRVAKPCKILEPLRDPSWDFCR